jgi:hypothetical protein
MRLVEFIEPLGQCYCTDFARSTMSTIVDTGFFLSPTTHIAFEDEESQLGLSCVAAPVRHRDAGVVAGLSVTGPRGRIDTRRLSAELRRVAAAASLAISRVRVARAG